MSRFLSNDQPKSTHKSNYITEIFLEMYDVEELINVTLPLKFTTINHYQREYPGIKSKLKAQNIKRIIWRRQEFY